MAQHVTAVPELLARRVLLENLELREQPAGDGATAQGRTALCFSSPYGVLGSASFFFVCPSLVYEWLQDVVVSRTSEVDAENSGCELDFSL